MQAPTPEVTTEVLQTFADAWNRHDVDALMSFMTEDCVFESSTGADICGTRYAGREAVRAGFAEVWPYIPMPTGGMPVILSMGTGEYLSGRSQDHDRTERASRFMAVIYSLFVPARSPLRTPTVRPVRPFRRQRNDAQPAIQPDLPSAGRSIATLGPTEH